MGGAVAPVSAAKPAEFANTPARDRRILQRRSPAGRTSGASPAKGKLWRILYDLLERALRTAGIGPRHLEELADRGDGVLILIRPYDDVPKTVLLGRLIPALTALLAEHNAAVAEPELRMRLRAVVHAGEVHDDGWGFYGDDIDVAFRLLEAPTVKRVLRDAPEAPLVLVVSEEIWAGIVRHGYVDGGLTSSASRSRWASGGGAAGCTCPSRPPPTYRLWSPEPGPRRRGCDAGG